MADKMFFWRPRLENGGAEKMMQSLDFAHQQLYLPFVTAWGLNLLRRDNIIEFGCGPCGLAPWFQRAAERVAVEPLADDMISLGIDYAALGFNSVYHQTAQDFAREHEHARAWFDLAIACNVIDHDPQPQQVFEAIAGFANTLFVCYDLRFKATPEHPGITVAGLTLPEPWECSQRDEISLARWPGMLKECKARRCELWVKR